MWKFQDFSAPRILREINFGHFEATKSAIFNVQAALNFELMGIVEISIVTFSKNPNSKPSKLLQLHF